MYYDGQLRQRGAGLGDVFRVLARTLAPTVLSIGKNFVKRKAATLGPRALEAGVGVVKDLMAKKTFKQAVKQRGKRLLSEAINTASDSVKRQKTSSARASNRSAGARGRASKKRPRKNPPRNRDIFD